MANLSFLGVLRDPQGSSTIAASLKSQWPVLMGYFKPIMVYFGVPVTMLWATLANTGLLWGIVACYFLGYLAFQVTP